MNANIGNDENELHTPDVVPDFPTLTLEEVQNNITLGTYQIKQAAHYTDEHLHNEGGFTIYLHRSAEDLIRVRIQSRRRNSTKYFTWVQFKPGPREEGIETVRLLDGTANARLECEWWAANPTTRPTSSSPQPLPAPGCA